MTQQRFIRIDERQVSYVFDISKITCIQYVAEEPNMEGSKAEIVIFFSGDNSTPPLTFSGSMAEVLWMATSLQALNITPPISQSN